jgi:hypothetical protein
MLPRPIHAIRGPVPEIPTACLTVSILIYETGFDIDFKIEKLERVFKPFENKEVEIAFDED